MKLVRNILILVFTANLLTSCLMGGSDYKEEQDWEYDNKTSSSDIAMKGRDGVTFHTVNDPKTGMAILRSPLPKDWKINATPNAPVFITGPNNIKVNKTETYNYAYANDQFGLQTAQQMGMQISPVLSLEQILQQYIVPSAQSQGYSLVKNYNIPGLASFWRNFMSRMNNSAIQKQIAVMGTEWKDNKGNMSFISMVQIVNTQENFIAWQLQTTEMEAPVAYFEDAKNAYIYGLENTQINPEWQQWKNQELIASKQKNDAYWRNATIQSTAAHQQRMASIAAQGNAARNIGNIYSDISDISHEGYMKRSGMNSAGHSKTIDAINSRTTVFNPNSGEQYKVDSGNDYYWVNNNNEYIGTDNSLYDPRLDPQQNNTDWSQTEIDE